eukprot:9138129-Pyramimonas_sp.AAC.2
MVRTAKATTPSVRSPYQIGELSQRTNQTHEARVYSHDGPLRRMKREYILMTDQSDTDQARTEWSARRRRPPAPPN